MAGDVPLDRGEDPAPPRGARRAEVGLHHSRHRRPDPPDEADHPGGRDRREALAGAAARRADRPLEEPRAGAVGSLRRRRAGVRRRARQEALHRLSGAAPDPQRRRLRRPAARAVAHPQGQPGHPRRLSQPLPLHPGRRVSGHQRLPVPVAEAAGAGQAQHLLRRRRRPVDLRLARRRGRQHPALREGFSGRQGDPPGAQLPLDLAHPRRRLAPHRPQRGAARQDAVHRREGPGRGARHGRLVVGQSSRRRAPSARRSRRCRPRAIR